MKFVATVEARMSSSRLPGKVLLKAAGLPLLSHQINRLKQVDSIDCIVLATTINKSDDILVKLAQEHQISCFRGSEEDVLSRVVGAGEFVNADVIVETTGDCPIIDPILVEQTIRMFKSNDVQYVSNNHIRSYPDGMDTQVFFLSALKKSMSLTNRPLDREHVTLFIRNHPDIFSRVHLVAPPDLHWPELGLTLDERSDYMLLSTIIESLYDNDPYFSCKTVIDFLNANPKLLRINENVIRRGDT